MAYVQPVMVAVGAGATQTCNADSKGKGMGVNDMPRPLTGLGRGLLILAYVIGVAGFVAIVLLIVRFRHENTVSAGLAIVLGVIFLVDLARRMGQQRRLRRQFTVQRQQYAHERLAVELAGRARRERETERKLAELELKLAGIGVDQFGHDASYRSFPVISDDEWGAHGPA